MSLDDCKNCICYEYCTEPECEDREVWLLHKENEELKERLDAEMLKVTQLATELVELKAYSRGVSPLHTMVEKEIERLRAENERLKELLSDKPIKTVDIDSSFEIIKLRQCLDEIEEICKECKKHDYDLCITCKYEEKCRGKEFEQYDVTNYIIQKIKEVKSNDI